MTHDLITVALTATVDAPRERVWHAIAEPSERAVWDDRILGEIKAPQSDSPQSRSLRNPHGSRRSPSHPVPILCTRWRFRWSGIPLVLIDEVFRSEGHDRLFGRISIGSMHFEQTLTVVEEIDGSGPHARLGMKIVASNSIAVIGELVPRLDVQRLVIEYVDTTLRLVRKHCEVDSGAAFRSPQRH